MPSPPEVPPLDFRSLHSHSAIGGRIPQVPVKSQTFKTTAAPQAPLDWSSSLNCWKQPPQHSTGLSSCLPGGQAGIGEFRPDSPSSSEDEVDTAVYMHTASATHAAHTKMFSKAQSGSSSQMWSASTCMPNCFGQEASFDHHRVPPPTGLNTAQVDERKPMDKSSVVYIEQDDPRMWRTCYSRSCTVDNVCDDFTNAVTGNEDDHVRPVRNNSGMFQKGPMMRV